MSYLLSNEEINHYRENGYLILKNLFSEKEIDLIDQYQNEVFWQVMDAAKCKVENEKLQPGTRFKIELASLNNENSAIATTMYDSDRILSISHVSWIGGIKPELLSIGRHPKITIPVAQLLQNKTADHLLNQAHYKTYRDHEAFVWHQDMESRRFFDPNWNDISRNGSFVMVTTALNKMSAGNGGLNIISKSHVLDLHLKGTETFAEREAIVERYYKSKEQFLHIDMQPGDTILMHPLLVHKEDYNNSNELKKAFMNAFSSPGANSGLYPGKGSACRVNLNVPNDI